MFFISVNKDIEKWVEGNDVFVSPDYGVTLKIRIDKCKLFLVQNKYTEILISHYRSGIFITDIKVWWYVRKLKKYSKELKENAKVQTDINLIKGGLEILEKNFLKEIRKQKLERLQ